MYSYGVLKKVKIDVPVISVGNLVVGGVGKTPFVIALARYFKRKGLNVGVVSKGYGRIKRGYRLLIKEEIDDIFRDSVDWGEEAVLVAIKAGVPVMVADSKSEGALLLERYGVDLVIIDDGFQHLKLERDVNILLIDGIREFGNRLLFPAGPLREPISSVKRADMVVVTKRKSISFLMDIEGVLNRTPVFFFNPGYVLLRGGKPLERSIQEVFVVTQVANPNGVVEILSSRGIKVSGLRVKRDHTRYDRGDFEGLIGRDVVITEKDLFNMPPKLIDEVDPIVVSLQEDLPEEIGSYLEELLWR